MEKVKNEVWSKYCGETNKGKCFCCTQELNRGSVFTEFGHIIPYCEGGEYTIDNIRPLCGDCNRGKGGMHEQNMIDYIVTRNKPGIIYLTQEDINKHVPNEKESFIISNTPEDVPITKTEIILNSIPPTSFNPVIESNLVDVGASSIDPNLPTTVIQNDTHINKKDATYMDISKIKINIDFIINEK